MKKVNFFFVKNLFIDTHPLQKFVIDTTSSHIESKIRGNFFSFPEKKVFSAKWIDHWQMTLSMDGGGGGEKLATPLTSFKRKT